MKKTLIICLVIFYPFYKLIADDKIDLKKNADAIIEKYNVELLLEGQEKASLKVYIKTQILNKNGDKNGVFFVFYDKFSRLKSFEGKIYNSLNIEIDKIRNKDLTDRSLINNFSLYEDNRIKYYEPLQKNYPYYVEYTYEIEYNGTFYLPTWQPIYSSHLSVRHASLDILQDKDNPIRYKLIQIEEPKIETKEEQLIYSWEIKNITARKKEPFRLPYSLTSPTIYIAPNNFSMDGFDGNMTSWKELGKWLYQLIKTQDELPEEAIQDIKELTQNISDKHEIAKKVYEYMQSRTRYVSIQEGIGGWQPIDANTVHELGYGDCKALTNYTKALLKIAGIQSYYVGIRAGIENPDIMIDFPSNQFNHALLYVPFEQDTIWLECTSQTIPFGYIGDFTGNKHALLITEDGGRIVNTTKYNKEDNFQKRNIEVELEDNGNVNVSIHTEYHGLQYENISYQTEKSKEDQKEFLLKNLELNNYNIKSFDLSCKKDINPIAYDFIELDVKNYANSSNSRIFFDLNILNKNDFIPIKTKNRISPIKFTYPYTDIDSIQFTLPENYEIEYLPENYSANNQFGEYSIYFKYENNKIFVTRKLSFNKGIFSPEDYNDLVSFFEAIEKYDKSKCVLKTIN